MQEKLKNASPVNFIKPFGPKISAGEKYNAKDDVTDQRAPVNNIEDLYDQFVVPDDVMEELDNERVEDFENDIYDYDDRSELGEDIALSQQIDIKKGTSKKESEPEPKSDKADDGTIEEPAD